jgi:rhodanese-related sulfurtransferase
MFTNICLCVSLILLAGCASRSDAQISSNTDSESTASAVYTKITPEEAKEMIDDGEPFILLDVRTEEEFTESHIEGAVLIPDTEIADRASDELPEKDARILVYCRTGRRSAAAANALVDMGYTSVYDFGGIVDWSYETIAG